MWNNWFFLMDLDRGPPYILPVGPIPSNSQGLGGPLFSQFNSLVDNSIQKSIQGAFNTMSKLTGDLVFLFTHASSSNLSQRISAIQNGSNSLGNRFFTAVNHGTPTQNNVAGFCFGFGSREELSAPMVFGNISNFIFKLLLREAEKLQSFSVLSFAAALVPPFDKLPTNALAVSPGNDGVQVHASLDQRPCQVDHQGCSRLGFYDLKQTRLAIEPRTGIEFPLILDNLLTEENTNLNSEVLVGTGSRTMKIIRIKSLKVYAFGFYVHPDSLCKKLGRKYGSIPPGELNKCRDFYEDLLREDIDMTVRLVINCNGMKINTVRDAFEKSLRARLQKTNPNTDYHCLRTFGSMFSKDIPLPAGTTVDFRQTAKGLFITEIEGNKIGTVDSKDLCRAFFDMYIGDVPVSEQAKQEIANNVGTIIRKC